MKLFLAYLISDTQHLQEMQGRLRHHVRGKINWVAPERFHVTVSFIGQYPESHSIIDRLKPVVESFPPFTLSSEGLGVFWTGKGDPRVLYAGLEHSVEMIMLHQLVDGVLEELKVCRARQVFRPHITLARINKVSPRTAFFLGNKLQEVPLKRERWPVRTLCLMNAIQSRHGVVYAVEAVFRLQRVNCGNLFC